MVKRVAIVVGVVAVLAIALWRMRNPGEAPSAPPPDRDAAVIRARPDAPKPERASIAGTVTADGKPVVARVCGFPDGSDREPRCATTDRAGTYVLADLPAASYRVGASAPALRPRTVPDPIELASGEHRTGVDLELRAGGVELTGSVADVSGGPIARAQVHTDATSVEADDAGHFTVWVAPGMASVTAIADGYAPGSAEAHAPGKVEVLLVPESTLAGTVVDAQSKQPVAGVRVSASDGAWWDDATVDTTDESGAFRIGHLAPGRYVALARDPHGYGRTASVAVGLGEHVEHVIIALYPAVQIRGRVVVGDAPCADATLSLEDAEHKRYVTATRDPDGSLHADAVLPGTYVPMPACKGYASRDAYDPIVVATADVSGLVWRVESGAAIAGRITTRTGEPIDGARISARSVGGGARERVVWATAITDKDGAYELAGLRDGSYRLLVTSERGLGDRGGYVVDAHGRVKRDITLDDIGAIRGVVVSDTGAPVAGVDIESAALDARGWGGHGRTDEAGAFQIDGVRPGDYRVFAQRGWQDALKKPGTTDDAKPGERITVRPGQTSAVRLVVEAQGGAIRGTVVDAAGAPIADAFVTAVRESDAAGSRTSSVPAARWTWDERPVLTATDGSFAVAHLEPGRYTLWADRKGGGEAFAEHVNVDTTIQLQIKPTASIAGHVTRAGGVPVELDVTVTDAKQALSRSESLFRTDGAFAIRELPAGHYVVTVDAEGGSKQVELDLADGEAKTGVDIALEPLATVTGRIVEYGTTKPVAGVQVEARAATAWGGAEWNNTNRDNISDDSGRFTVTHVPRGKVLLFGTPRDWSDSDYAWLSAVRVVDGDTDVGDVPILKKRVKKAEPLGDLGLHWDKQPSGTQEDELVYKVSWIDPAGPAAKSGLVVGDVVTAIDGIDITGGNAGLAFTLLRVPVGARVSLGLARGSTVAIVTVAP